jgi:hypothetical protein
MEAKSGKQTIEEHGSAKQDPSCLGMTRAGGVMIAGTTKARSEIPPQPALRLPEVPGRQKVEVLR